MYKYSRGDVGPLGPVESVGDFLQTAKSTSIQEGTSEQIDRDLMVIGGGGSKSGQIGSAFVLTGGIWTPEADHQIAQSG